MDKLEKAADLILGSHHAVALTGAGVSTPSGIADFRSPGTGLWTKVDPMKTSTIAAFRRDPLAFYRWFSARWEATMCAVPNPAHQALAELERIGLVHALITQNIDNLHQEAGSKKVIELHGNAKEAICVNCQRTMPSKALWEQFKKENKVPTCEACGGPVKPKVILFGELLPTEAISAAWEEAERCDLMLVAGSSLLVTPAADLPFQARSRGAKLVIVNYQPTPADGLAEVVINEDAAVALPKIVEWCRKGHRPS